MSKIKVMIVDDQSLMRDGLSTILNTQEDIDVVCCAKNGSEAIDCAAKENLDVILMDIRMPKMNGVEATKLIKSRYPDVHIIILTTFDDDDYIIDALSYGASGYLLKDIDAKVLIRSVRDVIKGDLLLPGAIASKLVLKLESSNVNSNLKSNYQNISLTTRETEISKLMLKGMTNKQISKKLYLTQGTVKNYITSIYSKLGTNDRVQAILILQRL